MIDDATILHLPLLREAQQVLAAADEAGKPAKIDNQATSDPVVACFPGWVHEGPV